MLIPPLSLPLWASSITVSAATVPLEPPGAAPPAAVPFPPAAEAFPPAAPPPGAEALADFPPVAPAAEELELELLLPPAAPPPAPPPAFLAMVSQLTTMPSSHLLRTFSLEITELAILSPSALSAAAVEMVSSPPAPPPGDLPGRGYYNYISM